MGKTNHPVSRSAASTIGVAIRDARKQLGWTAYRLAEKAGVSYNSVTDWEAGNVAPTLGTILHLADVLSVCSLDELLGGVVGLKAIRRAAADPNAVHTEMSHSGGGADGVAAPAGRRSPSTPKRSV